MAIEEDNVDQSKRDANIPYRKIVFNGRITERTTTVKQTNLVKVDRYLCTAK